ncbi:MAG: DUF1573 domain-containing protein, partial [Nitrospirota bacterium]
LFLALLVLGVDAMAAQPAIRFDQEVFTFRPVLEGDSVEVAFSFRSTGAQPLIIHDVSTSCGCTTAEYPSGPLKPGERGAVRTTFTSRGYSGDVDLTLLVKSNDAQDPMKALHVRGKVVRQWQVKPDRLVLTNFAAGGNYQQSLQIVNYMDVPLRIREIAVGADFIRLVSPPGEVPPGAERTIPYEVHLEAFEPGRVQQSSIRIAVTNARMSLLEVPVLIKMK